MKTTSVMIQNLCVPCYNHCRYCLLSWSGDTVGVDWQRGVRLADRYRHEISTQAADIAVRFSFGYSMEHPDLKEAIDTLNRFSSPFADFLQCDGMRMRDDVECRALMAQLSACGIKQLNFTFYGLPDYHDCFAGRSGDFALLVRMMNAAKEEGIPYDISIPITTENIEQVEELVDSLGQIGSAQIRLFIPHEEGRGKSLRNVRLSGSDLLCLSPEMRALLNSNVYKEEREWLRQPYPVEEKRQIIISFRSDNIEDYEKRSALSVIREIEALDEVYYSAFPSFEELSALYGALDGDRLFSRRDLYGHYRSLYAQAHKITVYDVTDERQSGSRRY